jgi:hypothetical protein
MPASPPFPQQAAVEACYGEHGEPGGFSPPTRAIKLPFRIYYDGKPVGVLRPHERCAESLLRVFQRLAEAFPDTRARKAAGLLEFAGLYNPRRMRGNHRLWSMHAWAIAIDLDAARNGYKTHWPTNAVMPLEAMECFAREGWTPAGAFWGRDAMHFQATAP